MFFIFQFFYSLALCITIEPSEERSFLRWMRETKNFYTGEEYHFRFGVWLSNYRFVQSKNSANSNNHFKCGMNSLSALTPTEYRSFLGTRSLQKVKKVDTILTNSATSFEKLQAIKQRIQMQTNDYPDNLDYRTNDPIVLNPIQDVGTCSGGDWSFSMTASIETNHAIKKVELFKLSEQCLIDCVEDCDGCNSGSVYSGFNFLSNSQTYQCRINSEPDYSWRGSKGNCEFNAEKSLFLFSGVIWGHLQPESDMLSYLNTLGIGSVSLDASQASFQLYESGIYHDENCGKATNHAINVVGYGVEDEVQYWICRNCWGTFWGEKGYFRILRGVNECGIANEFGFPIKFF